MFVSRADIDQALRQPIEDPNDALIVGRHFIEKGGGILRKGVVALGYGVGRCGHVQAFFKNAPIW